MLKSKPFPIKDSFSYYFSHFLTQIDSALITIGIPTLSYSLLSNYGFNLKELAAIFLLVPLQALGKLTGGFFYGLIVNRVGVYRAILYCLLLTGGLAMSLSISLHAWQTIDLPPLIPAAFFLLLKASIHAEKAFNLMVVIDESSYSFRPSIPYYQFFSLLAVLITGFFFYFFEPRINLKFLGNAYAIFGILFVIAGLMRLKGLNRESLNKIPFKNYLKLILDHRNLILFCSIIFGIDQFSYQAAINLTTTIFFQHEKPWLPISLLNCLFILLEISLLPIISKWLQSRDQDNTFIPLITALGLGIPLCLFLCQFASFPLFFSLRMLLIILGLSYSLLMMGFLKNYLPKEGFLGIFISKSLGSILIATPLIQAMLFSFSRKHFTILIFTKFFIITYFTRNYIIKNLKIFKLNKITL